MCTDDNSIECPFKDKCTDYSTEAKLANSCGFCSNNTGRRSYFEAQVTYVSNPMPYHVDIGNTWRWPFIYKGTGDATPSASNVSGGTIPGLSFFTKG